MNEVYRVGDDAVFIPGREAQELAEAYGITDPERQERAIQGVVHALRKYISGQGIVESRSGQVSLTDLEDFIASGGRREMLCSQCERPLGETALRSETTRGARAPRRKNPPVGLKPSRLINKAAHTGQGAEKQGRAVKSEYVPVGLTLPEYLKKEFTIIRLPTPQRSLLTDPREFPGQDQTNSSLTELPEY